MKPPSERSATAQSVAGNSWHAPSSSSASWPAPVRKPNVLALEKSPEQKNAALFPAPVQASAFAVPRPVGLEPSKSPWPAPAPKALILRRTAADRLEVEFMRPPFGSPGEFSRTC